MGDIRERGSFSPREFDLSHRRFRKCIVVLMGLPLTGKSTLGHRLADMSNFTYLDVDEMRQELSPGQDRRSDQEERQIMLASYQRKFNLAVPLLEKGDPVVLGATYSRPEYEAWLRGFAQQTDSPVIVFRLHAPKRVLQLRLSRRPADSPSVIRTEEELDLVIRRYAPSLTGARISTKRSVEASLARILKVLEPFQK